MRKRWRSIICAAHSPTCGALGPEAHRLLSPSPRALRLDLAGAFCDVTAFDRAANSPSEAMLKHAVDLYSGALLAGCSEEWIFPERQYRIEAYLNALEKLAQASLERGDAAFAARWLRLTLAADAYRESAACSLMQVLSESGDRAAMQQVYQELRLRLYHDLNAAPSPETEALYQRLHQRETQSPPGLLASSASVPASQRHLPVPLTDLIGREQEKAEVADWLQRGRLVTLLGSGGVGKTRLAIAVAEAVLPRFPDGVWFVDLAPLTEASLVPEAAAKALGLSEQAGISPLDRLTQALTERSLLMVLDNCEHLLPACAALAYHLLSACRGLTVLVTSRQSLSVTGEQIYQVPSLATPPEAPQGVEDDPLHEEKDPQWLLEYAGVRLFAERAAQVRSTFRLTRSNSRDIVEICQRLDGIPLALEMAAARLRSLSPAEVNKRLSNRFQLLTTGNKAGLPRQQTLRATLDWSYDILDAGEKALLCQLSVFAGGCALEGAVAVSEQADPDVCLETLSSLVEKSLIIYVEGEWPRYRILETVRQYCWERLEASGESEACFNRHSAYFLALVEEAEPKLTGGDQTAWFKQLEEEYDNLRAALSWSLSRRQSKACLRYCGALRRFWWVRGYLTEGRAWCVRALEQDEVLKHPWEYARTLNAAGLLAYYQGDNVAARAYHEEGLAIQREIGDTKGIASSLNNLGLLAKDQCDYVTAREYYEESLSIQREREDGSGIASALSGLGLAAWEQGDYAAAHSYHEEALNLYRQRGDKTGIAGTLNNIGLVFKDQGNSARARAYYEEGLAIYQEGGNQAGIANSLNNLGPVAWEQGDCTAARAYQEKSLILFRQLGDQRGIAYALESFAGMAAKENHFEQAATLWGVTEALRENIASPLSPVERVPYNVEVTGARQAIGEEAFSIAWTKGRAMPLERAIASVFE